MASYYNEIDSFCCDWLRQLIRRGLLPDGEIDNRSIEDVKPDDLREFTQCHFFAGIGGWPYTLRLAGWPDDRQVWTGSCPCQPFSTAGKRTGTSDERHLWPSFFWLISQCRPDTIIGEQVASKDALAWWDIVHTDLEAESYACGVCDTCAAGFGAPHIRQRLYWFGTLEPVRNRGGGRTGWRSPCNSDGEGGIMEIRPGCAGRYKLRDEAPLASWPTPQKHDAKDAKPVNSSYKTLARTAMDISGWSTPKATEWKIEQRGEESLRKLLEGGFMDLTVQARLLSAPCRLTASGQILTGSGAGIKNGGRLNPALSRWLMGFPKEWCLAVIAALSVRGCKATAMR